MEEPGASLGDTGRLVSEGLGENVLEALPWVHLTVSDSTASGSCQVCNPVTSAAAPAERSWATAPCSGPTPGLWCRVMASSTMVVASSDRPTCSATHEPLGAFQREVGVPGRGQEAGVVKHGRGVQELLVDLGAGHDTQ